MAVRTVPQSSRSLEAAARVIRFAASVELSSKRFHYKEFHDLRSAIVVKNTALRKQRLEAIEKALTAAFDERPVPTIAEVGDASGSPEQDRSPRGSLNGQPR